MRYSVPLAALLLLTGLSAHAARGNSNMAGCGLGSLVIASDSNGPQVFAMTTNGTMGNQMFGITSGTSGCSSEGWWAKMQLKRKKFIVTNYRSLSRELAAGDGEYAVTFAKLMGCGSAAQPAFLSFTKGNYDTLFPAKDAGPDQLLNTVETEMAANPALSQVCSL